MKILSSILILISLSSIFFSFTETTVNQNGTKHVRSQNQNSVIFSQSNGQSSLGNAVKSENYINQNNKLFFEQNLGQKFSKDILFSIESKDYTLFFLQSKIEIIQINSLTHELFGYNLSFQGANLVSPIGLNKLIQTNNYFLGMSTFIQVPLFSEIIYSNLYPGIDLTYFISDGQLKYDFIVHSGANYKQIKVITSDNTFMSIVGSNLAINDRLNLNNLLFDGNLRVYQEIKNQKIDIPAQFKVDNKNNNVMSYNIGSFSSTYDLIIDPFLVFNTSTYLGGSASDIAYDVVRDNYGNIYITGSTQSNDFITHNAMTNTFDNLTDIFIMKINSTGNGIIWSTYFGGNGEEQPDRIALDGSNNVVVVGYTNSTNFPGVRSALTSDNNSFDGFVITLANNGSTLVSSLLIGGGGFDEAFGLYIPQNSTYYYITGTTTSSDFFTTSNAYMKTYSGNDDAFLIIMNSTHKISYASYIGGSQDDDGIDVGLDSLGNIFVTGWTSSNLTGLTINGIFPDIFLMKFTNNGSFSFCKLVGGSDEDYPTSMAISNNQIYITGYSYSIDFPTNSSSFQTHNYNNTLSFVLKLNTNGGIIYSTYFGGSTSSLDFCSSFCVSTKSQKIQVDSNGNATIVGYTNSNNIKTIDGIKSVPTGSEDGFITTFNNDGTNISYSTYIGGNGLLQIYSFVLNSKNEMYIVGDTDSTDFPVNKAIQNHIFTIGDPDAFFSFLSLDYTIPTLVVSSNITYQFSTTGHILTFSASDNDPQAFYKIFKDGNLLKTSFLTNTNITVSIDGLNIGIYNYTVLAQDRTGNHIAKSVFVQVVNPSTNNNQLFDQIMLFILAIAILGLAFILTLVILKNYFPQRYLTIATKFTNILKKTKKTSADNQKLKTDSSNLESQPKNDG